MGPLELMLGVLGGAPAAVAGLVVVTVSFWGNNFAQSLITGHQLVLYGIFGALVHALLRALEERHDTLEAVNARLEAAALRDPGTGLLNRRALEAEFAGFSSRARGSLVTMAMWDLDGLKLVNDACGHEAGDRYLRQFAEALRSTSAEFDGLYRVGGDEFVSLHILDSSSPDSSLNVLIDRVRAKFPEVSVGWVQIVDHDLDAALLEVDALMYTDKLARRSRVPRP
jgi:diguanylate cyclase (GGDEF)-like protein